MPQKRKLNPDQEKENSAVSSKKCKKSAVLEKFSSKTCKRIKERKNVECEKGIKNQSKKIRALKTLNSNKCFSKLSSKLKKSESSSNAVKKRKIAKNNKVETNNVRDFNYDSECSDLPEDMVTDELDENENSQCSDNNTYNWSSKINYYPPDPFTEFSGCQHNLMPGDSEESFFQLFIDEEFFLHLAEQTNLYAEQCQKKNGVDKKWYPTTSVEMKAYIGILIYMGIYKLPESHMYFENNNFFRCDLLRNAMPLYRFEKLNQYLHLNNDEAAPARTSSEYDILHKARPALNVIKKFSKCFKPFQNLAVDEAMIKYKGRLSFKQYMPNKPDKWGIKVWRIADSKTGYFLNGSVYLGKKEVINKEYLLGEQVVLNMAKDYADANYHVYFDNFFTSVNLMKLLLEKKIYSCGTLRSNRKNIPESFSKPKNLNLKKGESLQFQSDKITATVWHDTRDVLALSTNCDGKIQKQIDRRNPKSKEKIKINCPLPIINYTENMGGVDLSDQKRAYYGVGRTTRKWWKYILYFVIDVAAVNSFIIYDLTNQPCLSSKGNRQLQFRLNLVSQLIGDFSSRKYETKLVKKNNQNIYHVLKKMIKSKKYCVYCKQNNYFTNSGKRISSSFKCGACNVPLCKTCFDPYHDSIKMKKKVYSKILNK